MGDAIIIGITGIVTLLVNRIFDFSQVRAAKKKAEVAQAEVDFKQHQINDLEYDKFLDRRNKQLVDSLYTRVRVLESDNELLNKQVGFIIKWFITQGIPWPPDGWHDSFSAP